MKEDDQLWADVPEHQFKAYLQRLELVEILTDDTIPEVEKRKLKSEYMCDFRVTDRTIRNYLHKYRKKGAAGLLFWRRRTKGSRIENKGLAEQITTLIEELPSRSVPQLRRLLSADARFKAEISTISDRTIYRFLAENGMEHARRRLMQSEVKRRAYHSFSAPHSLALVQGDARDGIWLNTPEGKKIKTYLFLWIDDYSRKILFGKYYTSEKLPLMEDSFKNMILRYGIPDKCYLDNGKVYISRHFAYILSQLGIRKIHHKPYQAHCKGKVESDMKIIKHQFQNEASLCGMKTVEELNSAFWAWMDVYFNKKIHSSTGQTPDDRFFAGLQEGHKRVTDIEWFSALFLWRNNRKISKYGKIKLYSNEYPVFSLPYGTVVQVRFDPFDLDEVYIYDQEDHFLEKTSTTKQVTKQVPQVPEESKKSKQQVSRDSIRYFSKLRQQHLEMQKEIGKINFSAYGSNTEKEKK
ncbi:MAG TPA: DDE-type integrase/transposase/recombinase [Bacteroidales bacterium]|nr:DDE-type integrase/transposase/recombinase [Bacteroidales bacterium]